MDLKQIIKMRLMVGLVVYSLVVIALVVASCSPATLDMTP